MCERRGLPCGIEEKVMGPKSRFPSPESLHFKPREGQGLLTLDFSEQIAEFQPRVQTQAVFPSPPISEAPNVGLSRRSLENQPMPSANGILTNDAESLASMRSQSLFTQLLPAIATDLRVRSQSTRRASHPEWSAACYSCIKSSREVLPCRSLNIHFLVHLQ